MRTNVFGNTLLKTQVTRPFGTGES